MANWNGLVMTDKGIALQSKVQAGEVLNITKLKLGSGTLPEETDIRKLTDLIKPEQNLGIGGREPNGDYCKISATISNVGLEAGYYVRELGVFAQDPDDGEILYAYTTDGAPDYLPAEGGSTVISQEFSVNIAVSDTDKINVEIDPGALATMGYVQLQINEHNEDAAAHEQAFSQHNTDETAHYDMTGATGSKAGKRGFVPAPKAGDQNKALFGNGQYQEVIVKTDIMVGATSSMAGKAGLVPTPAAGTQNKALFGDGQYKDVITLDSEQTISAKKTFRALYLQNTDTKNEGGELKFIYSKNINKTAGLDLFHLDSQNPALRIIDYSIMTDSTRVPFYFWLDGSITTLQGKVDIVKTSSFGENFKYIRYASGKQEVWCIGQATTTNPIITLPVSFSSATVLCNDVGVDKASYSAKWLDSNRVQLFVPSGYGYNLFVVGTGEE